MATYSPLDLFRLWTLQKLPLEMATGHILQNLVTMQDALDTLKRELAELRANKPNMATPSNKNNSSTTKKRKSPRS